MNSHEFVKQFANQRPTSQYATTLYMHNAQNIKGCNQALSSACLQADYEPQAEAHYCSKLANR